ncbi:hypothetical protein QCD85_12300 [Paenibacillus sp. PsM32]|uniref:prenylated flavin chaperone LpdD n=1 Tax=Paenibacillus sp. PsM32 TaxID=3030536 RepID=UPI00263BBA01|nr:hypothetical protein [Paenibacillus sp. PsM32]MDN4618885.1 hypothetical protein [Paenibacillus sp. PsM32]
MIHIHKSRGRIQIQMDVYYMGTDDIVILISGGDRPHIGTITAGTPNQPLQTIQFQQHQEFYFTEEIAIHLRKQWRGNFVICGGVHIDQISGEEINQVIEIVVEMGNELIEHLQESQSIKS